MIDIEVIGVQLSPNPSYSGEPFIIKTTVKGKALRWNDISSRTWNQIKTKGWD